MGKKIVQIEQEISGLQLQVSTLIRRMNSIGENYDRRNFFTKRQCYIIESEPKVEPLPEGVKFYQKYATTSKLFFLFGREQIIYCDEQLDYRVTNLARLDPDVTSKCHLEPCKIENLKRGDWFMEDEFIILFISMDKSYFVDCNGSIISRNTSLEFCDCDIKKIVYIK